MSVSNIKNSDEPDPDFQFTTAKLFNGNFAIALYIGDPKSHDNFPLISSFDFKPEGFNDMAEAEKQCLERI